MTETINKFGIDVETHDINKLIGKLKRLKSTVNIENNGVYCMDNSYAQILIDTTKTEKELDHWLWKYSNCDYIGIFENN